MRDLTNPNERKTMSVATTINLTERRALLAESTAIQREVLGLTRQISDVLLVAPGKLDRVTLNELVGLRDAASKRWAAVLQPLCAGTSL